MDKAMKSIGQLVCHANGDIRVKAMHSLAELIRIPPSQVGIYYITYCSLLFMHYIFFFFFFFLNQFFFLPRIGIRHCFETKNNFFNSVASEAFIFPARIRLNCFLRKAPS